MAGRHLMGRLAVGLTVIFLLVGCGSGASPTPTQTTPPSTAPAAPSVAVPTPTLAPAAPAPRATPVAISAAVNWDGQTCSYAGKTDIPRGAAVTFTLTNAPSAREGGRDAGLLLVPVVDGTTWEQIKAYAEQSPRPHVYDVPPWALLPGVGVAEAVDIPPDVANAGGTLTVVMTRNLYLVKCVTPVNNFGYNAILLHVVEA